LVGSQGLDRDAGEKDLPAGRLGLELAHKAKRAGLEVDIGPAQSEQLALPHPGGDRQDVEGLQPVAVDGSEEGAGLVSREDPEVVASLAHYRGSVVEDGQTRLQRP
jgi:hypothetical protein